MERFKMVDYGYREGAEKTIAHFAPKGKIHAVIRILQNGHRRLRLYAVSHGELCRVDQLINKEIFEKIISGMHYDADYLDYNGFDRTDGTDMSGFGWPAECQSNVCLGTIYTLAEIVHGDRNAWTVNWL
jgi:hypothetical protein